MSTATAPVSTGRKLISTPLSNQTFAAEDALTQMAGYTDAIRVLPESNMVKIGGQSIMDRGKEAVFPLIEEIAECSKRFQICIGAGGGTRARHSYALALDLDLPTGLLASIGVPTSRQNARILQMLLACHGGVFVGPEDFEKLPLYFKVGCIPVMVGMPPYDFWEKPPEEGRIPANRTDSGVYLTGEFLGSRKVIFVKDEHGLYTDDPKKDRNAKFIPRISVQELLASDLADMVVEKIVLTNMLKAQHVKEIQIVNGLVKGNLTRALEGEPVGTVIYVA